MSERGGTIAKRWQDASLPIDERVADLLDRLTLEEKLAQLNSVWIGATTSEEEMAPHQHDLADDTREWPDLIAAGLGQLTRPFGTAPVDPATGMKALARLQADVVAASRFGIPAQVHEECLSGLMTWGATVYPTPLAWGASFDPDLVERMGTQIGSVLRMLGVHQGLAPVLDVVRDARWGRTEETLGEDPYLVGSIGAAYVRGIESAGVVATLKHFAGYSASRAGRNFGPVSMGRREFADVILPPFEMAVYQGGARSIMHSYAEIDGVPTAADESLLTDLVRGAWGFEGTVVSDYFGVSFLELLHHIAGTRAQAAALALTAGVDVELPAGRCYCGPLRAAVEAGAVPEALVDRAVRRVLRQKCELGLLDADWEPAEPPGPIDLDPPAHRAVARRLAEESVVLLANDGALPLAPAARIAVVGPLADTIDSMLGCYTFPSHVGSQYPEVAEGIIIPTLLASLRHALPDAAVTHAAGCGVDTPETADFAAAVEAAAAAEICVAVLGDRAGLFGKGTSGEGSDAADLCLPGVQGDLLDALLATGTPVVLVLFSGRPYALGTYADRLAAVVQTFFPGEEGGPAVAGVLAGQVCPSGRLPVSVPRHPGGQPTTYLGPALGHRTDVSTTDPTALFPFGHGLSYTAFEWSEVTASATEVPTDGALNVSLTVRNTGELAGADVVQLYLHDPVAQVTRPVVRLIGYARVPLRPGQSCGISFHVPADLAAFTGLAGRRIVEPGELELRVSASSADHRHVLPVTLTGPERVVDHTRRMVAEVTLR
jgi:beta-xylosidase